MKSPIGLLLSVLRLKGLPMKNIRKSAVAAATALALTLGGVAAAHAEEATPKLPTDVATQQGLSSEQVPRRRRQAERRTSEEVRG